MPYASYIPIFVLFIIILLQKRRKKKGYIIRKIIKRRKGDCCKMKELIKNFIDKECIIYAFETQITGVVKQVTDTAVLVECKDGTQIINTDFIVRVREYPRDKNGKKKSVIFG